MKPLATIESVIKTVIKNTHISLVLGAPNDDDNDKKTGGYALLAAKRYFSQNWEADTPSSVKRFLYHTYVLSPQLPIENCEDTKVRVSKKWVIKVVEFPNEQAYVMDHPLLLKQNIQYTLVFIGADELNTLDHRENNIYLILNLEDKNYNYFIETSEGKRVTGCIDFSQLPDKSHYATYTEYFQAALKPSILKILLSRGHISYDNLGSSLQHTWRAIAQLVRVGNCGFHAHIVVDYLWQWQQGNKDNVLIKYIEIVLLEKNDHAIVVINRNQTSALDRPNEWGDECYALDAWKGSSSRYDLELLSGDSVFEENIIYIKFVDEEHFDYFVLASDGERVHGSIDVSDVLSFIPDSPLTLDVLKPFIKKIEQITSRNGHTQSYFYPSSLFETMMTKNGYTCQLKVLALINPLTDTWHDNWRALTVLPPADVKEMGDKDSSISIETMSKQAATDLTEHKRRMSGFFKTLNERNLKPFDDLDNLGCVFRLT